MVFLFPSAPVWPYGCSNQLENSYMMPSEVNVLPPARDFNIMPRKSGVIDSTHYTCFILASPF